MAMADPRATSAALAERRARTGRRALTSCPRPAVPWRLAVRRRPEGRSGLGGPCPWASLRAPPAPSARAALRARPETKALEGSLAPQAGRSLVVSRAAGAAAGALKRVVRPSAQAALATPTLGVLAAPIALVEQPRAPRGDDHVHAA